MELFRDSNFDFLGKKTPFLVLSLVLLVVGIGSLVAKGGPQYGIDFKGGTLLYVKFDQPPSEQEVRTALAKKISGEISVVAVQGTNELMIQTELKEDRELQSARQAIEDTLASLYGAAEGKAEFARASSAEIYQRLQLPLQQGGVFIDDTDLRNLSLALAEFRDKQRGGIVSNLDDLKSVTGMTDQILGVLKAQFVPGKFQVRNTEVVGPKVGAELRTKALLATLYALGGMLIYIGLRFEFVYGFAAVVAVLHDTIITIGLFSLFDKEISLTVVAAILTLVGYSMNDTIVVFDRIRENLQRGRKGNMREIVNRSVNETLSRTVMTSGLTLLTALALLFFGGQVLNGFAFALVAGIIVGTYSSIFVASPILVYWQERSQAKSRNNSGGASAAEGKAARKAVAKS
jgi:preprotein translocase subunit SecF